MIQLLLLAGLLFFAVLSVQRFLRSAPPDTARKFRRSLLAGGAVLVLLLAATGRLAVLIPVAGALLALLVRLLPVLIPVLVQALPFWRKHRQHRASRQDGANTSTVESRYLRMRLDHAGGELTGEILAGNHAGRQLSELSRKQLINLYEECIQNDPESATLLGAYLERVYGESWETLDDDPRDRASEGKMTIDEAYAVLGLERGASREDIVTAHRRLMQRLHPDRGGSDYLAAKINQAKDLLLGG